MKKSFTVKKFVRLVCGGLLGLISLSLVGVGFSSWLITSKDSPSRDTPLDSIGADGELSDINNYISYNNSPIVFEFCQDGLIDKNGRIVNKGEIIIGFSIQTKDSIKEHLFVDSTSFTIATYLYDTDKVFFSNNTDSLFTNYFSTDNKLLLSTSTSSNLINYNTSLEHTAKDNYCSASFTVSEFLDQPNLYFSRKYPFVFDSKTFHSEVYSKLSNGTFKFSFKAEVVI